MTVLILIVAKLLLTREESAEILSFSVRKLDQLAARGELKPRRIDDSVRFYVGDLIQFASGNKPELRSVENTAEGSNDHSA